MMVISICQEHIKCKPYTEHIIIITAMTCVYKSWQLTNDIKPKQSIHDDLQACVASHRFVQENVQVPC